MHDKVVRRRRAVLALLVALSLFLLTAYFGESAGGGLHSVQRGSLQVLAPIQEGANKVLKPARDLFGWFGSTLDAKDQRDQAIKERDALRVQLAQEQSQNRQLLQLKGLQQIDTTGGLDRYAPVSARVYRRSPSTWYQTATINKGSSDGLSVDDPVVNGQGLVGKVESVSSGNAVVMLLTDQDFGAAALAPTRGEPGSITPIPGAGGDLLFDLVDNAEKIRAGDLIVTAGTTSARYPSVYPRSILIGTVKRIEQGDGQLDRRIHVAPAADLLHLDLVQVLTKPDASVRADATATP
ncbi:MAG: rod shape-determining protein MreC [Solirubrobacteraceae bacterium]|jgi:rod shape-determining protein MreC|nr:rod shape-determining protein MreC [Solirubrobacteraceae bacterium]